MSLEYIKLSEVAITTQPEGIPHFLVEDNDEIKRIPFDFLLPLMTKADWEEDDPDSPAFILNKPQGVGGGGGEVIVYTNNSGLFHDGVAVTPLEVVEAWGRGAILRVCSLDGMSCGNVVHVSYSVNSGNTAPNSAELAYIDGTSIATVSC